MTGKQPSEDRSTSASSPDDLVKDLPISVSEDEASKLVGGKFAVEYKPQKADGSLDAGLHFKYEIR